MTGLHLRHWYVMASSFANCRGMPWHLRTKSVGSKLALLLVEVGSGQQNCIHRTQKWRHAGRGRRNKTMPKPKQLQRRPKVGSSGCSASEAAEMHALNDDHYFRLAGKRETVAWETARHTSRGGSVRLMRLDNRTLKVSRRYVPLSTRMVCIPKQNAELHRPCEAGSALYNRFQAAACGKDMDHCRTLANARLRCKCEGCNGTGEVGGQFPDGSYQTDVCPHCEGNGFVEIPELPSGPELVTHNIPHQLPPPMTPKTTTDSPGG